MISLWNYPHIHIIPRHWFFVAQSACAFQIRGLWTARRGRVLYPDVQLWGWHFDSSHGRYPEYPMAAWKIHHWLVVTGTMEFYDFPFSWEVHHPNWRTQIFQRGRYTTTRWSLNHRWLLNPSGKHTKNDGKSQLFIEKYIISMAMFNSEVSKMTRGLSSHWRLDRKLQPESHGSFPSQLSSLW